MSQRPRGLGTLIYQQADIKTNTDTTFSVKKKKMIRTPPSETAASTPLQRRLFIRHACLTKVLTSDRKGVPAHAEDRQPQATSRRLHNICLLNI